MDKKITEYIKKFELVWGDVINAERGAIDKVYYEENLSQYEEKLCKWNECWKEFLDEWKDEETYEVIEFLKSIDVCQYINLH